MKSVLKNTALAAIVSVVAMPAIAMTEANVNRLVTMGFEREVLETLTDDQLAMIERELHNGSDSDARRAANTILLNALMMQMMEMMEK